MPDPSQARIDTLFAEAIRLHGDGRPAEAADRLAAVVAAMPDHAAAWKNLAVTRLAAGDKAGALAAAEKAVALEPGRAGFLQTLGNALVASGRQAEAVRAFRQAVALQTDLTMAWNNLGLAILATGEGTPGTRTAAARHAFRRALASDTGNAAAWNNLGASYYHDHLPGQAVPCLRMAVAMDPAAADHRVNLGNALREAGRVGPALRAFAEALQIDPGHPLARSNLIYTLDFDSGQDTASQQAHRTAWARQLAPVAAVPPGDRVLDPERPLRIGYVSRDFMQHSAAAAFAATIMHRDREMFRVSCYDSGTPADTATGRFRAAVDDWCPVSGLSDRQLAARVQADAIDILVDLSGHTAGHRLEAFAYRPAPLQISAWGHCTGTGMQEIDVLFGDPVLIPTGERSLFAERVVDLPCAIGFEPLQPAPPAMPPDRGPDRGPDRPVGEIVFGALGRGVKAGPECIRLWARALHATPGSRLYLKDRQYADRTRVREIVLTFAACGIDESRLAFEGATDWQGHMQAYWQVDIALDTFPHAGGMTTLEALWMGVPTIALRGRFPSGRASAAILAACGRSEWIAEDEAAYVALAARLGAGVRDLRSGRARLREQLRGTMPFDGPAYAAAVERVYRSLWRAHCTAAA